ncbi:unnamed protein product [Lepeophtheirus salmonis]|uniref:(salmon louse) hypothetical protein n=1 Tax=Lepeophtheirus salmonis TaxID=72036 RepID=A0A7R8D0F1_LEPSM|nr:unnamed protein product [Lepeophtheirus salmonis]CAF2958058.1 unnamed protein product [Lepeophtheirus salmonis]
MIRCGREYFSSLLKPDVHGHSVVKPQDFIGETFSSDPKVPKMNTVAGCFVFNLSFTSSKTYVYNIQLQNKATMMIVGHAIYLEKCIIREKGTYQKICRRGDHCAEPNTSTSNALLLNLTLYICKNSKKWMFSFSIYRV